ncbi:HAMP domain-containing histidine kinase [Streptomyces lunaelactis]|uniref:sensor histidine kinase n=1 Tax=Streptomyces lunaelactis TaxID=1535768 RepID=UPI001584D1A0|nr:HAMP domain-containing sensor histidine kinase [Streptomyces lunaelactis]NUK50938.1 HAMP domain-containing histidine kinase [Streptomyces lunaelactis]
MTAVRDRHAVRTAARDRHTWLPPRPAWAAAVAAAVPVTTAAAWLQYLSDGAAGPLAAWPPDRLSGRTGSQTQLLEAGYALGAVFVGAVCWLASRGELHVVRLRTAGAATGMAFVLLFTNTQWLHSYNGPDVSAPWGLTIGAPTAALLVGAVAWAAFGRGQRRIPLRGRLALTSGAVASLLLILVIYAQDRAMYIPALQDLNWFWIMATNGVPAIGLLTGALPQIAAGRALRPVEAIRRRLEEITASSLDQRVPAPDADQDDEIARLARTTNATLDRLEQSSALQRQFVADTAHELRSPLAGLRAQLESASRRPQGVDWPSVVEDATADVIRLQALAEDLLLLARLDATDANAVGGAAVPAADAPAVDLAELAEDLVREYRHLSSADGLELALRRAGTGAPAVVPGDALQLERLLRNLLDNACRHAAVAVMLRLTTDDATDRVVIDISDDGPGIPPAERDRVFERFIRLDDARARATGGTGLGLPIAREIALRHGGTLTITDRTPGATLRTQLPRARAPRAGGQGSAP